MWTPWVVLLRYQWHDPQYSHPVYPVNPCLVPLLAANGSMAVPCCDEIHASVARMKNEFYMDTQDRQDRQD
jgi:hypothetical protein